MLRPAHPIDCSAGNSRKVGIGRPFVSLALMFLMLLASASSAAAAAWLCVTECGASDLTGRVRVVDGDTLEMAGTQIRLWGIDAPERKQTCQAGPVAMTRPSGGVASAGRPYACGRDSAAFLAELTRYRTIRCDPRNRDRNDRVIAICRSEVVELNAEMVRRGWAVDFTPYSGGRYQTEEQAARSEKLGMWSGRFDLPWAWRGGR